MHSLRAVLLATLTLCGFAVALPTAAAPSPANPADVSPTNLQSTQNVTNGTLGSEISSFMQVSTSQTKGTVETGLWVAQFNKTKKKSARKTLVRQRVNNLQNELEDVKERKDAIVEARKNGEISMLQYQAEMSEIVGEIRSLEHSINRTKPRAETAGTRVNRLKKLDKQADTVGGPEVAEVARSLRSVTVPGENGNNSTGTPGIGIGDGNGGVGIGNGNGTIGIGNGSNGSIGNGSGNGTIGIGIGNGNDSSDDNVSLALLIRTGRIV